MHSGSSHIPFTLYGLFHEFVQSVLWEAAPIYGKIKNTVLLVDHTGVWGFFHLSNEELNKNPATI